MAKIIGIHGIGQQFKGPETLRSEWFPALCDGITLAGGTAPEYADFKCAFYGDLFRGETKTLGLDDLDLDEDWFEDFAELLAQEQLRLDTEDNPATLGPGSSLALKLGLNRALRILFRTPIFGDMTAAAVRRGLGQVHKFLMNQAIKQKILDRMSEAVTTETEVIVAHSLGTVVAYEALHLHPEWNVHTLITMGSPLGIRKLVFDKLTPLSAKGIAPWPGSIKQWVNVADSGDIVTLQRLLRPLFGDGKSITDHIVNNGWSDAHDATRYLSSATTGAAVALTSLAE